MGNVAPLSLRIEVPPSELSRASSAASLGPHPFAAPARFDDVHLRGRVFFEIGVPLDPDPVLRFLSEKRGLRLDPPITATIEQPVAHVVGQLAGASVLALHGEGEFTLPLWGSRGALTVAVEEESFVLGVPLESYAGVVRLPKAEAAGAIALACRGLAQILRAEENLRGWPLLSFLDRESAILEALAKGDGDKGPATGGARLWSADAFARAGSPAVASLASLASQAEVAGAHVVPYWGASRAREPGAVDFEPLRPGPRAAPRGALARYLFPGGESALVAEVGGDAEATGRLRARLGRPVPFTARFGEGGSLHLLEPSGALPMA